MTRKRLKIFRAQYFFFNFIFYFFSIFGIYSTYIFLSSSFFRKYLSKSISDIVRDDLPYVDRILQLCSDIYLAREQGDLKLEEDLYAKLIFLYRSPETMIRWTRLPDDWPVVRAMLANRMLRKCCAKILQIVVQCINSHLWRNLMNKWKILNKLFSSSS